MHYILLATGEDGTEFCFGPYTSEERAAKACEAHTLAFPDSHFRVLPLLSIQHTPKVADHAT